jgi:hypothetical protein
MAKKKVEEVTSFDDDFLDFEAPEGASEITGDIVGYWNYNKSAIRCIPRSVKMFDGNLEKHKVSCLILAELTKPCPVFTVEDDKTHTYQVAPTGQMVGIWYKPGMRAVVNKAGVDCYIKRDSKKDKITKNVSHLKKPNPMKGFLVMAGPGGIKIPIIEDTREESAYRVKNGKVEPVLTAFHDRVPGAQRIPNPKSLPEPELEEDENIEEEEQEDNDINF